MSTGMPKFVEENLSYPQINQTISQINQTTPQINQPAVHKFCMNCGTRITAGQAFCTGCGNKL